MNQILCVLILNQYFFQVCDFNINHFHVSDSKDSLSSCIENVINQFRKTKFEKQEQLENNTLNTEEGKFNFVI